MAGHSKWAKLKRAKAVTDSRRGKVFSRISKEITVSARSGGGDPDMNPRLRTILMKAREANMPADNIDRAIQKGTGELGGQQIEQITYEGYGPAGAGLIIEVTTDNKNRAAANVRSVFTTYGGNLAQSGAVSFQFKHCGQFLISKDQISEDKLMELALEAGADDVRVSDDGFEVLCAPNTYYSLSAVLEKAGLKMASHEIVYLPNNAAPLSESDAAKVQRLIDALEELEDVQNVFSSLEHGGE